MATKRLGSAVKHLPTVSLDRLPKAPKFTALHFRDVTPGSTMNVASPFVQFKPRRDRPLPSELLYVDPEHPVHWTAPRDMPVYISSMVLIRAMPFARLAPHASAHTSNPYPYPRKPMPENRVPISIVIPGGPQSLHKSGCIRTTIRRRLKEAVRLLVTRGASSAGPSPARIQISVARNDDIDPSKWLLKDWTYVVWPRLSVFKAPLPELISEIRNGLESIKAQGTALEKRWLRDDENAIAQRKSKHPQKPKITEVVVAHKTQPSSRPAPALPETQRHHTKILSVPPIRPKRITC